MLKEQWMREQEQERKLEQQKHVVNKERNLELLRHNDAEKILKDEQLRFEKERDKEMLNRAISREKEIERLE